MTPRTAAPAASAADFLPARKTLPWLRRASHDCQGCDLFRNATQTVFGEGAAHAKLILVGEQPGDKEDIEGRPFVGPAGKLLDQALAAAGIDREEVYVTNAVKHFKWTARGKRRIHSKPSSREIAACRPWLSAEIEAIHPQGIICLGATAAQSMLGPAFRITKQRGQLLDGESATWKSATGKSATREFATWIMATYHPSAVLRAPDDARRRQMREELIADLKTAAGALA